MDPIGHGTGDDPWTAAVHRFADWLADFSPAYRQLRTEVIPHEGAPARLAEFWRIVGWAPGVGLTWAYDKQPQRPERALGRAAAAKAFKRWLAKGCFAPALGLAEPTVRALWDRLPARCWVHYVSVNMWHVCHGGYLYYVDEDAGDDPAMMIWDTAAHIGAECRDAGRSPARPSQLGPSAVAVLVDWTVKQATSQRGTAVSLPAPPEPGPFAPVYPHMWPLGEGVWGVPHTHTGPDDPRVIRRVVYRSPRAYLDHLAGLPAEQLVGYAEGGFRVDGTHQLLTADARELAPHLLAERGFGHAAHGPYQSAVGDIDGVRFTAQRLHLGGRPHDEFFVLPEDYKAFRELLRREKIKVYQHLRPPRVASASEPTDAERALAARLAAAAASTRDGDAASTPRRPRRRPTAADTPAAAAVRDQAALLRRRVLAAHPRLELTPPVFAADEHPLVRALWETIGYDEEWGELVGWADLVGSDIALAETLADYLGWDSPLRRRHLPKRCRLVEVDGQGCGLAVTDETDPGTDPPVLAYSSDTAERELLHPSYLIRVGEQLTAFAAEAEVTWVVRSDPPLDTLAEAAMPRLVPAVRRLADTVWAEPTSASMPAPAADSASAALSAQAAGSAWWRVTAPSFAELVDWLAGTGSVDRFALREAPKPSAWVLLTAFTPPEGLRDLPAPDGPSRWYAGVLDGLPVLINALDGTASLYTAAEHAQRARALAADRGWLGG